MLPNWLYGKSKSKLAELLGGGGTPSDYAEVKAQVAQNAEDIALLDTSNQALTTQSNSIVNILGAKNLLPNNITSNTVNGITFTVNSDGSITANGTATADAYFSFEYHNFKSGSYILNGCPNGGSKSGPYALFVQRTTAPYVVALDIGNGANFTLSQDQSLQVRCKIWNGQTISNLTFYPMIRLASIADDTYVPYAMTNQELTEKLTSNANLGTAVDLSSYNAYSNLYTAPSDGYVHFVSAASGSAARTIYTYGNNTTAATDPHFTHSTSANNKAFEIFIKKGLKVYIDGLQSGDTINFYPLS